MRNFLKLNIGYLGNKAVESNPQQVSNGAIALIGASGNGKSVEAQRLLCEIARAGGTALVISHNGTFADDQVMDYYRPMIEQHRNDIYANRTGIPCRLFDPLQFSDGESESAEDVVDAVTDIISRALNLGQNQMCLLRQAVEIVYDNQVYQTDGFWALGEVLRGKGGDCERLYQKLRGLFRRNIFFHSDGLFKAGCINVVHLEKLDQHSQEILVEMLLAYIWRLSNAEFFKQTPLYLFVDECQDLSSRGKGPLALMLSEGRKFGINLIVSTQMILNGSTKPVQQRLSQCGLMLYFKPAASRNSSTAKMISQDRTAEWAMRLARLKVGEFVAVGDFLLDGREVDYPLVVTANIDKISDFDHKRYQQREVEK